MPDAPSTVLLVDDQELVRVLAIRILERAGYRVLACASGEAAVELAGRHLGPIDVLLTDIGLGGMDGHAVAEAVRAMRPGIGVVLMSGYSADEVTIGERVPGARFVAKPYAADTLVAIIDAAAAAAAAAAAQASESGGR